MSDVKLSCEFDEFFSAQVDGRRVKFLNGEATLRLSDNKQHVLQWFARGAEGTTYSISIDSPESVKFKHGDTLDEDGRDAGHHWFKITLNRK